MGKLRYVDVDQVFHSNILQLEERKEAKRKAAWGWASSSNDEKKAEAEEKK
jgi:hypothetical protein